VSTGEARLTLYQRVLGDRFDALPPVLRVFHSQRTGGSAVGTLRVTRTPGLLMRLLGPLLDLPDAGEHVPARVEVVVEGDKELWIRTFNGRSVKTLQWEHDGLLVEARGPLRIGIRLSTDGSSLRFEPVRAWFGPVPMPAFLAPGGRGLLTAHDDAWHVDVSVEAPLIGALIVYQGDVSPTSREPAS
jgi:hypothetical protein